MSEPVSTAAGTNYTAAHLGPFTGLDRYSYFSKARNAEVKGKPFLKEPLGLTGMEVSLTLLKPLEAVPFFHSHKQNEELFLVVSGEGEMQVDDDVIPVKEGSAVRVGTAGERCIRNTSATEPFVYVCIQAKTGSLEQWTSADGIKNDRTAKWATG